MEAYGSMQSGPKFKQEKMIVLPEEKIKLRDAFLKALQKNPHKDSFLEGTDVTVGHVLGKTLSGDAFYTQAEKTMQDLHMTVDEYILHLSPQFEGKKPPRRC